MTYQEQIIALSKSVKALADVLTITQQKYDEVCELYHELDGRFDDARAKWKDEQNKNIVLQQEKEELSHRVEELLKRYEGGGK